MRKDRFPGRLGLPGKGQGATGQRRGRRCASTTIYIWNTTYAFLP